MPSTQFTSVTPYPPSRSTTAPRTATDPTTRGRTRTTRPTTTATSVAAQDIICAITESRGISPTVGLAFVNLSTSEAALCQICDSQTYARTVHKLAVFDPTEILFTKTAKDPRSKLYSIVEENLPHLRIVTLDRRYWAEKTGHEYVEQLAFSEDLESIKVSLEGNYFVACCLAAVRLAKGFACYPALIRTRPSLMLNLCFPSHLLPIPFVSNMNLLRD